MFRRWSDPLLWVALAAGPAACWVIAGLPGVSWSPGAVLGREQAVMLLAAVVVVYPLLEEWLFRGNLQPWLTRYFPAAWHGLSWANVLTSGVFTTLHLLFHPPLWALSVFLPSLVFGYFRDRHRHLDTPIALHAAYNASYTLLLAS